MLRQTLQSPEDIEQLIAQWGFLPFFAGEIDGFSIEEHAAAECWFPDDSVEGVWEWKGPVIVEGDCAYGKFYQQKACFVSMEWFPDFMNYRRSLFKPTTDEKRLLNTLREHRSLLSKELKRLCGYVRPREKRAANPLEKALRKETNSVVRKPRSARPSFDTAITRLQMGAQVVTADFEYQYDKQGKRYGWGVTRYCTPEDFFGEERLICRRSPRESRQRLYEHLQKLLPKATERQLNNIIG